MYEFISGTKKAHNTSSNGNKKYNVSNQKDTSLIDLNYDMTHIEQWDQNNFLQYKIQIKKIFSENDPGSSKCLIMLASMDKFLQDMQNNYSEMKDYREQVNNTSK